MNGTYTPLAGDFDGDGRSDIFWYRPGTGADYVWYFAANGGHSQTAPSVNGDFLPTVSGVAGYDRDGTADIIWYSPTGADYRWDGTAGRGFNSSTLSISGLYLPLVGSFVNDPS